MVERVRDYAQAVGLIDHHCHFVLRHDLNRQDIELYASESDWSAPDGSSVFDSPLGVMIRAEASPLLDLPRHSSADDYVERRNELGYREVTGRLLGATGSTRLIIETGVGGAEMMSLNDMAQAAQASTSTVLRLEATAERLLTEDSTVATFADRWESALDHADVVGYKTVIAYRAGLDFDPARPTRSQLEHSLATVVGDAGNDTPMRLSDETVMRYLIWSAMDRKKPVQFHVGYGDADITMHRCDPTQMTEFIRRTRETGSAIVLLHCYPFQREASYLAHVYPHVYVDAGAAVGFTGAGSIQVIREALELAPFSKVLYSSDAFGLPELYLCGAHLWRRGTARVLDEWIQDGYLGTDDALRYFTMMASGNAARIYGLELES